MTSTIFQEVDNLILENDENIMVNEMVYVRNHKALVIDEKKFEQILSWIKFYENIMPKGRIDKRTIGLTLRPNEEKIFLQLGSKKKGLEPSR